MKTIIAIDPGKNGGIAWERNGEKACCIAMPKTDGDFVNLMRVNAMRSDTAEVIVYLEDLVRFMGRTPMSHMAVYASNWGFVKGVIQGSGFPLHVINAKAWQKALGLGVKDKTEHANTEWKNKLKGRAQEFYPHLDVTLKTADALLILSYAKLQQIS